MWLELKPQTTLNLELEFKAIRDFFPLPKVVIFIPDRGVLRVWAGSCTRLVP